MNQAPFFFDLSVMDLYTCLACGGTLWCLEKEVQEDYQKLMDSLKDSGAGVWVSTPSFAELCLADPGFEERLLPRLRAFLFCGETLPCATVRRLKSRFPQAVVVNTYGPTESTVAVTEVEITVRWPPDPVRCRWEGQGQAPGSRSGMRRERHCRKESRGSTGTESLLHGTRCLEKEGVADPERKGEAGYGHRRL